MSEKVYVVFAGSYEDTHVVGVCRTKEAAEAYVAWANGPKRSGRWDIVDPHSYEEWAVEDLAPGTTGAFVVRGSTQMVLGGTGYRAWNYKADPNARAKPYRWGDESGVEAYGATLKAAQAAGAELAEKQLIAKQKASK